MNLFSMKKVIAVECGYNYAIALGQTIKNKQSRIS